jgi:hypothetical protein
MIPVAADHAADVIDGDQFPGFIPDVLPARNFFEHQKTEFVAGVEKMAGLRIVRSADDIALEFAAKNVRISALDAARHGLSGKGERLMTVKAAQLDDFAVQFETVISELGFSKANGARVAIH